MVRTQLNHLFDEILKYLGIPYFANFGQRVISSNNALVGKGTAQEIALQTIVFAKKEKVDLTKLDNTRLFNFQKKHHLGIDCSGLVFNLLSVITDKMDNLVGTEGKTGVRRLSANLLTSLPNAHPISLDQVKPTDLIRADGGKHVMLVIKVEKNRIDYIHSSQFTVVNGVHLGSIFIKNKKLPLEKQEFTDITKDGLNFSSNFDSQKGDGFYRLFLFD